MPTLIFLNKADRPTSRVEEEEKDPLLTIAVGAALVEGFMRILNGYGGDEARLTSLIGKMLSFVMGENVLLKDAPVGIEGEKPA